MALISPELINILASNLFRILALGNIILLLGLIYTYKRNHNEFKSKYTSGLLFFATVFLLQNIIVFIAPSARGIVFYSYITLEFIALAILLKIST
ncbi:hypothetical protein [Methanobacterium alcaliphilum]|uniref:hypothetical protein n=1 Tax=Methanobacterium alcaliphilum TaxID=392018 RepID=UPI00200B6F88|nr:hypothetical protein [Methanobacterium alcaliphilum]MCK9152083.1 hypothetical protein [Methanobacterium alcaliphilum]